MVMKSENYQYRYMKEILWKWNVNVGKIKGHLQGQLLRSMVSITTVQPFLTSGNLVSYCPDPIQYIMVMTLQMSKSFVINQAQAAVCDIVEAVENKFTDEDYLDVEEPGYFVTKIDQVGAWKISGVLILCRLTTYHKNNVEK